LFLIFAGAMVTSTGSGLAVPDWPLSYGMLLPPMVGGILYETGHRLIAGSVGFLIVLQALALQFFQPNKFIRKLGWSALGCVLVQGLLGGLTVLFLQPHALSVAHGAVAEILLCLNVDRLLHLARGRPCRKRMRGTLRGHDRSFRHRLHPDPPRRRDAPHERRRRLPRLPALQRKAHPRLHQRRDRRQLRASPRRARRHRSPSSRRPYCFRAKQFRGYATTLVALLGFQIYFGIKVVFDYADNKALYHSMVGQAALHHAAITSMHVVTGAAILAHVAPARAGAFLGRAL
jgi:heme A synthase